MGKSMRSIITHNGQPFLPLPHFILNDEFGHTACNPHVSMTVTIVLTQENDKFNNFQERCYSSTGWFYFGSPLTLSPSKPPSPYWGRGWG